MLSKSRADPEEQLDAIDELIPPPRPWWVRLLVGLVVVSIVGVGAVLWGFGFVYPQPDCCGSGSATATMSTTTDGKAVQVTTALFNSSGRDLTVSSATASLPGATLLGITMLEDFAFPAFPGGRPHPLPAVVHGGAMVQLVITFVPTTCQDNGQRWGSVTARLDVANSALPSFSRNYTLPQPIFEQGKTQLSARLPDGLELTGPTTPLAAACGLLQR